MGILKWLGLIIIILVILGIIGFQIASSKLVEEAQSLPSEDLDLGQVEDALIK